MREVMTPRKWTPELRREHEKICQAASVVLVAHKIMDVRIEQFWARQVGRVLVGRRFDDGRHCYFGSDKLP